MTRRTRTNVPGQNRLLAALPKADRDRLLPQLEEVPFATRDVVYQCNGPVARVYFPTAGVFSSLIIMQDGGTIEVGTVGNEGMLGIPAFLGADRSPTQVVCQVEGRALAMRAEAFRAEVRPAGPLHDLVHRYTQALLNMIAQSTARNHLHSVEERLCRWLLMTHDRVGADELLLTQEYLAQMLGVRRPTVTVVAGMLQEAGLIDYHRGRITVLDRQRLEEAACECYRVVRGEFDRLLG